MWRFLRRRLWCIIFILAVEGHSEHLATNPPLWRETRQVHLWSLEVLGYLNTPYSWFIRRQVGTWNLRIRVKKYDIKKKNPSWRAALKFHVTICYQMYKNTKSIVIVEHSDTRELKNMDRIPITTNIEV